MTHFELTHYTDFKNVLSDYQMSDRARQALDGLNMVLIVAPTSTGKNTLIRELLKTDKYYFIVSDTTRPIQFRDGKMETNGVEYFFRTEEDFLSDLNNGEFLEAAIIHEQQVSGISIRELEKARNMKKVAVTDINIDGAENIKKINPNAKVIFLVPPSFEEWQRRIRTKSDMSEIEITNRLKGADKELMHALAHDYYDFIVAEDIENSVKIIDEIVHGNPNPHASRGKELIAKLHEELQSKFK